jgi:hypothetical protein
MSKTVENLKAEGAYREAGALAAEQGSPCYYGCHYGMRSSRALAMAEFQAGYTDRKVERALQAAADRLDARAASPGFCVNRIVWGK